MCVFVVNLEVVDVKVQILEVGHSGVSRQRARKSKVGSVQVVHSHVAILGPAYKTFGKKKDTQATA